MSNPAASPASAVTHLPSLDNTLGAIEISFVFVCVLYGVTTVQSFIYFHNNVRDARTVRLAVCSLWILDSLQVGLASHVIYTYTVTNFFNPVALLAAPWSFGVHCIFSAISNFIVTSIFAWRVWKLSAKKIWMPVLIGVPGFSSLAGTILLGALSFKQPSWSLFNQQYGWVWYLAFAGQAFADVTISALLTTNLLMRRTGFKRTDSLIRLLLVYSINACLITSTIGVATAISYAADPKAFYHVGLGALLPKLMMNSLLGLLNTRDSLRDKVYAPNDHVSIQLSNLPGSQDQGQRLQSTNHSFDSQNIKVCVDTTIDSV